MSQESPLPEPKDIPSLFVEAMCRFSKYFLIEGVTLILLGAAAIVLPAVAGLAVSIVLGWLFLIGGMVGLITTIIGRETPGFIWSLLSALVTLAAGAVLVFFPATGVLSLTLVLTAFLIADGLLMIVFGFEHRRGLSHRWGWLVINGVVDLILAAIILGMLPEGARWILGLIVGIDMLFGGISLLAMGLAARRTGAD